MSASNALPHFQYYADSDITPLVRQRSGETKLGETMIIGADWPDSVRFVILGLPEHLGVLANYGTGGAATAWDAFLPAFLNVQAGPGLGKESIALLGHLDCRNFMAALADEAAGGPALREAVTTIDEQVTPLLQGIIAAGKIPIVIGGGHNNAYPILRGAALALRERKNNDRLGLHAINLDAHSDFRPREGRHSGNGFRYAYEEGYLSRYAVVGLHENYNHPAILAEMASNPHLHYSLWEDIFLRERLSLAEAVDLAISFVQSRPTGVELDLDCITNTLSSAMTPCGISAAQARYYIHEAATHCPAAYLHLCEGAARLDNGLTSTTVGKLLAYLVTDFVRAMNGKQLTMIE